MNIQESKLGIESFLSKCGEIVEVTKTAQRNKKSLSGANYYGDKFHILVVEISRLEINVRKLLAVGGIEDQAVESFSSNVEILKSSATATSKKAEALKQLRLFCKAELMPRLESLTANPMPETEQVLPMAVVQGTRGYIEKIVLQANGCYEHQWYDACSVLIRRLVETLIIGLYEAKGKAADIKENDGNFSMLGTLVNKVTTDTSWNLARETKTSLPLLKSLGDRSAHNRHYLANKGDIDKVLPGLRITVEDLLHLAGLK